MCEELEDANRRGNMRGVFHTVKALTRKFQPHYNCIQNSNREKLTDPANIAECWREYCEELYSDVNAKDFEAPPLPPEPPPLRSEVAREQFVTWLKETAPDQTKCLLSYSRWVENQVYLPWLADLTRRGN